MVAHLMIGFVMFMIGFGTHDLLHRSQPVESHTEPLILAVQEAEQIILDRL